LPIPIFLLNHSKLGEIPLAQIEILDVYREINNCIDQGFSNFGSSVSKVIYWKFEFDTKLGRAEAARRPDLLSKTIREIFRDGSKVIEDAVILQLRSKFQLADRKYVSLEDAIGSIRKQAGP